MSAFPPGISSDEVAWVPNDGPQMEFCTENAREVLYGGAAGGGKSDALLCFPTRYFPHPKFRGLILRRSFPELADLISRSEEIFPHLGGVYSRSRRRWTFPSGARLEFGYLEREKDKLRYSGRAFTYIAFDELTQYATDSLYRFLMSRLRTTKDTNLPLFIRATANPGGPGHAWVRARFDIPDDGRATKQVDPDTGFRRHFIPARISDNLYLAGTDYEKFLRGLSENDRKALLEGRWDVYEGQAFTEWNPFKHICEPFAIPNGWKRWRGMDDGYNEPACCLWFAQSSDGDIYIYNEIYERKADPGDLGLMIRKRDGEYLLDGILDNAAFADTGQSKRNAHRSRGDEMNSKGCRFKGAAKGPGSRIQGKSLVHSALKLRADGTPTLRIFRNCKNLIRTLPSLPYDDLNVEDIDTSTEDHPYDALRYGLQRVEGMITVKRIRTT